MSLATFAAVSRKFDLEEDRRPALAARIRKMATAER
jgi:hypothetical protein